MDYEKDRTPNPDSLDVEWLEQSNLVDEYSTEAENVRNSLKGRGGAEEKAAVARAELLADIRKNPATYGIEKTTADPVNDACAIYGYRGGTPLADAYKKAHEEELDLLHQYEICKIAVKVISETRKAQLENLIKLLGMNYFSGPVTPRDLVGEWKSRLESRKEERSTDTRCMIKEALNKDRKEAKPETTEAEPRRKRRET